MTKYFKQSIAVLTICFLFFFGATSTVKATESNNATSNQTQAGISGGSNSHSDHGETMLLVSSFIFCVLAAYNKLRNDSYEQA